MQKLNTYTGSSSVTMVFPASSSMMRRQDSHDYIYDKSYESLPLLPRQLYTVLRVAFAGSYTVTSSSYIRNKTENDLKHENDLVKIKTSQSLFRQFLLFNQLFQFLMGVLLVTSTHIISSKDKEPASPVLPSLLLLKPHLWVLQSY